MSNYDNGHDVSVTSRRDENKRILLQIVRNQYYIRRHFPITVGEDPLNILTKYVVDNCVDFYNISSREANEAIRALSDEGKISKDAAPSTKDRSRNVSTLKLNRRGFSDPDPKTGEINQEELQVSGRVKRQEMFSNRPVIVLDNKAMIFTDDFFDDPSEIPAIGKEVIFYFFVPHATPIVANRGDATNSEPVIVRRKAATD